MFFFLSLRTGQRICDEYRRERDNWQLKSIQQLKWACGRTWEEISQHKFNTYFFVITCTVSADERESDWTFFLSWPQHSAERGHILALSTWPLTCVTRTLKRRPASNARLQLSGISEDATSEFLDTNRDQQDMKYSFSDFARDHAWPVELTLNSITLLNRSPHKSEENTLYRFTATVATWPLPNLKEENPSSLWTGRGRRQFRVTTPTPGARSLTQRCAEGEKKSSKFVSCINAHVTCNLVAGFMAWQFAMYKRSLHKPHVSLRPSPGVSDKFFTCAGKRGGGVGPWDLAFRSKTPRAFN